jgi:hypothetical protein
MVDFWTYFFWKSLENLSIFWVFFCYLLCAKPKRSKFSSRAEAILDLHPKKTGFYVRKWKFTTSKIARKIFAPVFARNSHLKFCDFWGDFVTCSWLNFAKIVIFQKTISIYPLKKWFYVRKMKNYHPKRQDFTCEIQVLKKSDDYD